MLLIKSLRSTRLELVIRHAPASRITLRTAPLRTLIRAQPQPLRFLRFQTTLKTAGPKLNPTFSPKFCVYHAGTGRITFLACLKLSTLFIFAFFGFVVTPAYYDKEGFSPTVARTAFCAIAPLVFVAYVTSPFVTFIHVRLPPFARQSGGMLNRYIGTISPQTELEITTMSIISKPRVSTVKLSELEPVNRRFGIVTMARDTTAENAARKWYMFPAVGNFSVQRFNGQLGPGGKPWAWHSVWEAYTARR